MTLNSKFTDVVVDSISATPPDTTKRKEGSKLTIEINGQPFSLMSVVRAVQEIKDPIEGVVEATRLIDEARDQLLIELAAVRRSFTVQAQAALRAQGMSVSAANRQIAAQAQTSEASVKRMLTEAGQYGVSAK